MDSCLYQQHCVDRAVELGVVGDLGVLAPHNLRGRERPLERRKHGGRRRRRTLPDVVTSPSSDTLTSMTVPLVMTPS